MDEIYLSGLVRSKPQIQENAKFCSHCGTELAETTDVRSKKKRKKRIDPNKPIISTRPVFVPSVVLYGQIPIQLFFTFLGMFMVGGIGKTVAGYFGIDIPLWFSFLSMGLLFFLGVPGLLYFAKKNTYAQTRYRFFPDRVEYAEGFFTAEQKTIKYKNVTEVNLRQNILQQKHGLGSVILGTPTDDDSKGGSGIVVSDIKNPQAIYDKVKRLVG